jgi:hypothetical protein
MPGITVSGASIRDSDRGVVPAVTTWSRVEGLPLSADLQPALQAAVADPLWLLCRQWQFLEFAGEDAGTPIEVRIEGERAVLSRYLPDAPRAGTPTRARDYRSDTVPLEATVESEPIRQHHTRLAVEAGVHLQWMFNNGRLNDLFAAAYPVELAPAETEADEIGADWRKVAEIRGLDARRLLAALAPLRDTAGTLTALPPQPVVPDELREKTLDVLRRWIAWYEGVLVDPTSADAWNPGRLEYAFAVSAQTSDGELVLTADEYADGTMDWYSMTAGTGSLGTAQTPQPPTTLRPHPLLPSPVEYPGKPADRFWEFEDSSIHFGAIDAGPTDLTRMLLVEFGLVYGNDWYLVPLRLPVGSLFRITTCTVRDTFGVVTSLTRSHNSDGPAWSLFHIADDYLFLPPTLAQTIEGEPIEQIQLCRDETANLAWGIERYIQGVSGDPYDRAEEASIQAAQPQPDGPPVDAALVYRLATAVPEHWIPFVPVPAEPGGAGTNPVIQLERRALLHTDADGQRRRIHPKGALLRTDPGQTPDTEPPLRIEEEEVPREGAVVGRSFQYARWFDGRSLLWLGRRKYTGRGDTASGLRFDSVTRPSI